MELTSHRFGPTIDIFLTFFLGSISQGNGVLRHSTTKKHFFRLQNTCKKANNLAFSKEANARFLSKMVTFPTFFFRQYRPGKCVLRYSRTKKRFSRLYKKTNSKTRKIETFPKGLVQKWPFFHFSFSPI